MNGNKTLILSYKGSYVGSATTFLFGKMVNNLKMLAIYFIFDPNVAEEMNYKKVIFSKIKKFLYWWKQRYLTLIWRKKNHLLKTYAYSKLIYVSSLTPVPKWVLKENDEFALIFYGEVKTK